MQHHRTAARTGHSFTSTFVVGRPPTTTAAAGQHLARWTSTTLGDRTTRLMVESPFFLRLNPLRATAHRYPWSAFIRHYSTDPSEKPAEIVNAEPVTPKKEEERAVEETETIVSGTAAHHEFKSETSKLLDIVAHSLYTDKEVFVRELISNASDALEKARHRQAQGQSIVDDFLDLEVHIVTDEKKKTLSIQDFGIGMTKEELVENLGTIAHSGTMEFLKKLEQAGQDKANIIGHFGVGFYSAFMVAKTVKVFSRSAIPGSRGYCWVSDGSGSYTISEAEGVSRGTKIVLELKDNTLEFSKKKNIENIIKKYSNFVGFSIKLNGTRVNTVRAVWTSPPGSLSDADHREFYQFVSKTYDDPLYRLHFASDSPMSIRAIIYTPEQHTERFGLGKMEPGVSLFSRKVLVQPKMVGLLPDWLRFVKGVVDCEDIPLHLSREHLQDSELVRRLGNLLTSRILKHYQDQAKQEPQKFEKFFREFGGFLKEGIYTDAKWKDEIAGLLRFETSKSEENQLVSFDEYVKRMPEDQKPIYYLCVPSRPLALLSPYYEGFKKTGTEVIFLYAPVDDFVMQNLGDFKGRPVQSIESVAPTTSDAPQTALSKAEVEDLGKWLKTVLSDKVSTVRETLRLVSSPAIVVDHESPALRRMLRLADPLRNQQLPKQRFEFNANHPIILQLNTLRKSNPAFAATIAEQLFDDALIAAGLLDDPRAMLSRLNTIIEVAVSSAAKSGNAAAAAGIESGETEKTNQ